MKHALAIVALTALASPARADVVAGIVGEATHLGGVQAGGGGAYVELNHHRGRLQVFGEAGLGVLAVGALRAAQTGVLGRLGAGVRWLPVTWGNSTGGIDLYVEGGAGVDGYWWSGRHVVRPDVDLGWGFQVRAPRGDGTKHMLLHTGVRLMLSHDRPDPAIACRGCVVSRPQTIDGGMLFVMGMSW